MQNSGRWFLVITGFLTFHLFVFPIYPIHPISPFDSSLKIIIFVFCLLPWPYNFISKRSRAFSGFHSQNIGAFYRVLISTILLISIYGTGFRTGPAPPPTVQQLAEYSDTLQNSILKDVKRQELLKKEISQSWEVEVMQNKLQEIKKVQKSILSKFRVLQQYTEHVPPSDFASMQLLAQKSHAKTSDYVLAAQKCTKNNDLSDSVCKAMHENKLKSK